MNEPHTATSISLDTTREKLIAAGFEAILNYGYHGASLTRILAVAGVPKGSFYHYFPTDQQCSHQDGVH